MCSTRLEATDLGEMDAVGEHRPSGWEAGDPGVTLVDCDHLFQCPGAGSDVLPVPVQSWRNSRLLAGGNPARSRPVQKGDL